jgi:predicted DNA-binding transcriptional regulator YafY
VEIDVLRLVTAAIRKGQSVEVLYQSMNERRHEPIWRRMSPHAFGSDGMRWHARAYCHIDRRFKDFLLSRCLEARDLGPAEADPAEDKQWMEFFKVVLKPNPNLGKNQRRVIELDYEMKNGSVELPVRKALLYYFQKRLRLDVAGVLDNPRETPIVVANRAEFDAVLNEQ